MADCDFLLPVVVNNVSLEEIGSNTSPALPGSSNTSPDLEANLTLSEQFPRRDNGSQDHVQRPQTSPQAHHQHVRTPESSCVTNAIAEQDVGVRHGTANLEEDRGSTLTTVGWT